MLPLKEQISSIVEEAALAGGYLIYEYSIFLSGEKSRVIVKIDSLSGISHSDCDSYSRLLSALLDKSDLLPNYSLEVSSPGIDRKLRNPDEFIRFEGSRVKLTCIQEDGQVFLGGIIKSSERESMVLQTDDGEVALPYTNIIKANLDM